MIRRIVHSFTSRRLITYLIVGILAFTVEYLSFVFLLHALTGMYALVVAQVCSFSAGLAISFGGNRIFTFNETNSTYARSVSSQVSAYIVLALINLCLSTVAIYVLVHVFSIIPLAAKVIVMAMVVSWNFLIFNRLIFKTN